MLTNTYDIINAGPKNRFLCNGRVVSNSGKLIQPQNFPRPQFKDAVIENFIITCKQGFANIVYDDVTKMASSAIRGMVVASEGKKLVVADLSSIEGRCLAWLAGEEWKIQAYRDIDKNGGFDMYQLTYAKTFSVPVDSVDKEQRQLGKTLELGLGYSGGVGAFLTFAKVYRINLDTLVGTKLPDHIRGQAENFYEACVNKKGMKKYLCGLQHDTFIACDRIKRMWREANPNISAFWDKCEGAVRAVLNGSGPVDIGYCTVDKKGSWVRVKLPSGRYLSYPCMKSIDDKLYFLGVNQYSRKFGQLHTYSGRIAQNITQAVARDILKHGEALAIKAGYDVLFPVHDEQVTEAPDTDEYNAEALSAIMSTVPEWAPGLPLAAAGFESYRYKKE